MDDQNPTFDWKTASDELVLDADLIIALKLENLPNEEQAQLLERMASTVQSAVAKQMMSRLDEPMQEKLKTATESSNPEDLEQFLNEYVPDFQDLVEQQTIKFKRAMLTGEMPETL